MALAISTMGKPPSLGMERPDLIRMAELSSKPICSRYSQQGSYAPTGGAHPTPQHSGNTSRRRLAALYANSGQTVLRTDGYSCGSGDFQAIS